MIDPKTGRYCLPCSITAWWYENDLNGALEGLPAYKERQGRPIIELLCEKHRYRFFHMPFLLQAEKADGTPKFYPNGVCALTIFKNVSRPERTPYEYGACSREDLRLLLESMEWGLRLLDLDVDYGVLEDFGILQLSDQPTVSLDEMIARAKLHHDIEHFLFEERKDPNEREDEPSSSDLLQIDAFYNDDDRISGEE